MDLLKVPSKEKMQDLARNNPVGFATDVWALVECHKKMVEFVMEHVGAIEEETAQSLGLA